MDGLEILEYSGEGYRSAFRYGSWRVAFLNWAPRFTRAGMPYLERHTDTDEVFVLLRGESTLLMGIDGAPVSMESGKLYAVQKNTWHNILVSQDAQVLIVENENTGRENTEYIPFALDSFFQRL